MPRPSRRRQPHDPLQAPVQEGPRIRGLVCQQRRVRPAEEEGSAGLSQLRDEERVQSADGAQRVAAHSELVTALRKLRAEIEAKSEYVGPRFSEEARKIHYEEVPARGIHGEATAEEAKALREEGIEFYPLPILPEDQN